MSIPKPHGGELVNAYNPSVDIEVIQKQLEIDAVALSDLELIGVGLFSPLKGFLGKRDYDSVVERMRLENGVVWSIPVTLPVSEKTATQLSIGETVKLSHEGVVYGVITIS